MSITKVKNYNISPYYDDFDETDNYHRILFRPGKSVQVRELTQMQTALQSQIDRFGQYNFNDGSRVVAGKVSINTSYDYIKVEAAANSYLSEFVGTTVTGGTNGVSALVLHVVQSENSDADTLFVQYTSSGTSNTQKVFIAGEVLTSDDAETPRTATVGGAGGSTIADPIGQGSLASIEEGIYFISGTFVYVPQSTLVLDKYSNTPSYIVGLQVTESLVSSAEDTNLLDNAAGVPNSAAPGANRYKIETSLIKESLDLTARTVNDYVVLLRINSGIIQSQVTEKIDTELTDRLARRTFEESGDYVVRPYVLDMREHLNNEAGNGGYLTAAEGGDVLKIAIGVEPSVAYVKGFRVENLATRYVEVDKTRSSEDQKTTNGVVSSTGFGNYVKLTGVSGTPDIDNYTVINLEDVGNAVIGTCRARGFEITGGEYRMYIFDLSMNAGKTFSQVHEFVQSSTGFDGNFLGGNVTLYETGENTLVYKLPADAIQTLKTGANHTADYIARVRIQSTGNITANQATFNMPAGTTLANNDDVIIVDDNGATVPVEMADSNVAGVGSSTVTVSGITSNGSGLAQGIFNVQVTNGSAKSKVLQSDVADVITYVGGTQTYALSEVDIVSLTSIVDSQGTDVTDKFILDNGQRSNFYTNGAVTLKGGQTLPAGTFTVTYNAFQHSAAGGDYFSVDSYPAFEDIPQFGGLELRDCIDFRPTKARSGATVGSEFSTGTGTSSANAIQPVGTVSTDITFYLSRIDKLALTTSGEFKIVKGISDVNPREPENIQDSITLYTIRVNPYVFNETDILPKMVDNRRYSMNDIGKLEKRINTLEYYTSLSLLEKSASEAQIFDSATGDMRFKNGFITDAFYGHNVGNSANEDYAVSVDKSNGILRPMFDERSVNLVRKVGDTGTCTKHAGGIVTLPITANVSEVNQPYSTYAQLVNPYSVAVWEGTIKLSPESDEWKEVERRPDVIIDDNGIYDQFVQMSEESGVFGTVWNEWENNWTGSDLTSTSSNSKTKVSKNEAKQARNQGIPVSSAGLIRVDKTTITAGTLTGTANRTGIESYVTSDIETKVLDDKILEINFIPFMRSRKVYFHAQLLKPDTQVFPYFSGTNISAYARSEAAFVEFSDQTAVETYEGETAHPDGTTSIITDSTGSVKGSFIIPRNDLLQFKTGTREFKLIDNANNSDDDATTKASESFFAQGLLETVEKTIVNTKIPRIATREVSDSKAVTESVYEVKTEIVKYYDPLAQTFVIDKPGGVYVTELDLFFATIDTSIPVSVSIRTAENGIPTQKIIPGTEVVIYPNTITTSADASVAKTISFDYPVHLQTGSEYAIVIVSNSDIYKVFVSETGGYDLTNADFRVIKQPYNGVFFTSANASTWSPEQNKDLKFNLKRAVFDTSPQTVTLVNDVLPLKKLTNNPLSGTNDSSNVKVKVQHRNHGMYSTTDATHQVTISGVSGTVNGIPAASLNGTHDVKTSELDSYVIEIAGQNVTTEDSQFGGNVVKATENQTMDVFKPSVQSIEFKEATITYSLQATQAASVDSNSQANYSVDTFNQIAANTNTYFDRPYMVASQPNENLRLSGGKSFSVTATLTNSGIDNITPVLDLNRASVIAVQNRINDNTDNKYSVNGTLVADTETTGTTSAAKYITKQVDLSSEADQLDIYMSLNKPSEADIKVFYKAVSEDQVAFDDVAWTEITPVTPLQTNDGDVYSDSHFSVDNGSGFKSFAVKIVLKSQNSSSVPTVRDFRAIATI